MARKNWERARLEDLGRRRGYQQLEAIPPIPGPPAAARKKKSYPCLPQPPKPKKKQKPTKVLEYIPSGPEHPRRAPLRPPLAGEHA